MALDFSKYEAQRRTVGDKYSAESAANEFGRFASQQRGSRNLADYSRDFSRGQAGFMGGFAKRGLTGGGVKSGAFANALNRRTMDYADQTGRIQQDNNMEQQRYQMQQSQVEAWRQNELASIEQAKQAEIAAAALALKELRPLLG